jgi:hypothetical protein
MRRSASQPVEWLGIPYPPRLAVILAARGDDPDRLV